MKKRQLSQVVETYQKSYQPATPLHPVGNLIYLYAPLEVRINGQYKWVISPTYKWCTGNPWGYNPPIY